MKKEELLLELCALLREPDKWLLTTFEDVDALYVKKFMNKIKLEYYFRDNAKRMSEEMKSLKLIPDNKNELDCRIFHRILFEHGDDKAYYDCYK